ncbi:MAG TPA: hypothetical protein VMR65_04555 [Candidatus Sulfotelmatobacter sp.]|nr:hypothetical protein [Candidatus Sulfotelmatobacter sp.]
MPPGLARIVVLLAGAYLALGLAFALPFAIAGARRIDPSARGGSWGFRVLIIPGAALFWPYLLARWARGLTEPPDETNAHRSASRRAP